jgi:AbrB family looped-hinge helix DNA binding protein
MAKLVKVRSKAQVTIPSSIKKKLQIEEGDLLEMDVRGRELVITVKKVVPKDQAWFWTERWQEGERQADADIAAGRTRRFDTMKDAIKWLHKISGIPEEE